MTQVLISAKFATSVFLYLFVRYFCGIMKYNYTPFIRLKGFLSTLSLFKVNCSLSMSRDALLLA